MLWGFIFPMWVPQCDSLYLFPLCTHGSLPPAESLGLCLSYLFQCCLISAFSCRACSASIQVVFWLIYTHVSVIYLYPWDEVSLGSSYSAFFPVILVLFIIESGSFKSPAITVCVYSPFLFLLHIFWCSVNWVYLYLYF